MNQIRRPQRRGLYLTGTVLLLTGIAWALCHYVPALLGLDERSAVSFNARLMQLHGAAAMVALVLLGSLLAGHVGAGWTAARNKPSGLAMLMLFIVLALTGYFLYYAGGESLRQASSVAHLLAGVTLPAIVFSHAYRRARRRIAFLARSRRRRRRLLADLR